MTTKKMTRDITERIILGKLLEINEIYKQYIGEKPELLSMCISPYYINAFNDPEISEDKRINVSWRRTDVDYDDLGD